MSELPVALTSEPQYALRTFRAEGGRLVSVSHSGAHWEGGVCRAACLHDPEHVAPVEGCTCGVYAWWTVDKLLDEYLDTARHMIAVIRMFGEIIVADNGVKASEAHVVAWWAAEESTDIIEACRASCPGARRYFNRDVMVRFYPPPVGR
jgi:hypothetical protein